MKNPFIILLTISLFSCQELPESSESKNFTSNLELEELYKSDQADRQTANIDWAIVSKRDKQREARVYELLDSNKVITSEDFANAAMIFQHGSDTIASGMAVKLMQKAVDLDSTRSKWLLAAAIDRDLMRRGKPQIYGTQYTRKGEGELWQIHDLDTTKISDKKRREYGVETLSEQKEKLRMMNKKKLSALLESGKSIDAIIEFIKASDLINSAYDVSERGINSFGYQLLGSNKNKAALKIFKLNTELYPEGFNTYDSYGECLLKMGKIDEGIKAYKKSLELNPNNAGAKKALEKLQF
ncbi:tetratricopeptide repeat protein [Aureispira anguillae]|nr:tetratricopeptide repeat protein [Aureispira anguillae]